VKTSSRILTKHGRARSLFALAIPFFFAVASPGFALSADCERLRRAIADVSSHSGQNAQFQAAAERQRGEIDRTEAYAAQIGCNNKKFLFFGSDAPPQCGQIRAQIGRMRANLDDLRGKAGGGQAGHGDLLARYNEQCAGQPARSPGIIDALFGQPKSGELDQQPLTPDPDDPNRPLEKSTAPAGEARAGGKAVCVRSCDGAFFPLSYSASSGRLDSLAEMCRALCPNAEVTLYTYPVSGEIEQAVSINGVRYMDSPTALRYRKTFDPSCSCRRRGQTWASALASAESLLGKEDKSDIIVTPEKAAELSRPKTEANLEPRAKAGKAAKAAAIAPAPTASPPASADAGKTDANGVDLVLRDAAATLSREGSGIAGGAEAANTGTVGEDKGKTIDELGPDGAKRKVRIIGN
jgi:hypothetical protein